LQRTARRDEDDLGVARGAVVVDAELIDRQPALSRCHALGVPERGDRVDAARQQAADRAETDGHLPDTTVVAAVVLEHCAEERGIRWQPGDADDASLEVARPLDRGLRDQRCERSPDERGDGDDIGPARARDREVVDVEHADVDAPAGDQLERIRARAGLADLQPHALLAVAPLLHCRLDRRVHGVGDEVQRENDRGRRLVALAASAARRDEAGEHKQHHREGVARTCHGRGSDSGGRHTLWR
jgi:hypothetical protein